MQFNVSESLEKRLHGDATFSPRKRSSNAIVRSLAKCQVLLQIFPSEIKAIGFGED